MIGSKGNIFSNAAGVSVFSGVAGAIIRLFGTNNTKKIVNNK